MKNMTQVNRSWYSFPDLEVSSFPWSGLLSLGSSASNGLRQTAHHPWVPVMDIKETDQDYFLEAELPGLSREDFTLKVDQGVLTLKGERKRPTTEGSEKDLRLERSYGSFTRKFSLPAEVESDAIKAEFKQGLLRVRVPKKSKPQPQEIDVDVMS